MDLSADREALARGKRASVPKHNKKPENRLYSRTRRGLSSRESDGDTSINPDAGIEVVAVCGNEARIYSKGKRVRRLSRSETFDNHGQAAQFAAEYEDSERRFRQSSQGEAERVIAPFYQVRIGGVVIDQCKSRERAHAELRAGGVGPKELWLVQQGGSAELLEMVPA